MAYDRLTGLLQGPRSLRLQRLAVFLALHLYVMYCMSTTSVWGIVLLRKV
jgi:hypothetical protein